MIKGYKIVETFSEALMLAEKGADVVVIHPTSLRRTDTGREYHYIRATRLKTIKINRLWEIANDPAGCFFIAQEVDDGEDT